MRRVSSSASGSPTGRVHSASWRRASVRSSGDIVGIDVLERGESVAVDEFAVQLRNASSLDIMVREIEEVDGASVEEVRIVDHFPDPRLDALESAASLCAAESIEELHQILVGHIRAEFLGNWSALVIDASVLASSGDVAIEAGMLEALAAGTAASPMVADGSTGPDDLAVAALPKHDGDDVRRARRPPVPPPRATAARGARGHRRPRVGAAGRTVTRLTTVRAHRGRRLHGDSARGSSGARRRGDAEAVVPLFVLDDASSQPVTGRTARVPARVTRRPRDALRRSASDA